MNQNGQKNELLIITSNNSESTMFEKEADLVINQSLFSFKQTKLMEQIDHTLVNRDEVLFMELSKKYSMLLSQYNYLL
ncbi:IDEAL domain-containing protein [Cytobacillus suaedae]|nr:IDEAL domain-containing protein [Cytobacillus suaedae]